MPVQAVLAAPYHLNVQPVSVCIKTLSAPHCTPPDMDEILLKGVWAQAGIDVSIIPPTISEPFAVEIVNDQVDAYALYSAFMTWKKMQGITPHTVYVGLSTYFQDNVLGLSGIGDPYAITQGEGLHPSVVGYVAAHEIGHSLGADHVDGQNYLMNPVINDPLTTGILPSLSDETILAAINSQFVQRVNTTQSAGSGLTPITVVPVPVSWLMLLSGIFGLLLFSPNVRLSLSRP